MLDFVELPTPKATFFDQSLQAVIGFRQTFVNDNDADYYYYYYYYHYYYYYYFWCAIISCCTIKVDLDTIINNNHINVKTDFISRVIHAFLRVFFIWW